MTFRVGLLSALALFTWFGAANAATIGSADARVSLLLENASSGGGLFFASAFLPDPFNPQMDTSSDASSFADASDISYPLSGVVPINVGEEIVADVSVEGQAFGPLGFANAFVQAGVFLQAFNTSVSELSLDFLFGIDLFAGVSVTDPSLEFSVAFSDVSALISSGSGFDVLFRAFAEADSDFGPLQDSVPGISLPYSMTLAPNTSRTIALTALAQVDTASLVSAPTPVPLPLPAILLVQALALLSFLRGSKRVWLRKEVFRRSEQAG